MTAYRAKPLAATRINPSLGISSGLIGAWLLGSSSGPRAIDSAGKQDGTLTNFALTGTTSNWVSGPYGKRLNFDGTNDYVAIASTPRLLAIPGGDVTVSCVISYTSILTSVPVWCFASTASNNPVFLLRSETATPGRINVLWRNDATASGGTTLGTTTTFNDGLPHLVVVTKSLAGSVALWIDGKLISTTTGATGAITPDRFAIGTILRASAGVTWQNNIENVCVWNRVISTTEIYKLSADPFVMYRRSLVPAAIHSGPTYKNWYAGRGSLLGGGII